MCILLFIAFWLLRIEVSKEKNCIVQTMQWHHIHLASSNLTAKRVVSRSPLRRPHLVPFMSACIVGLPAMYSYRNDAFCCICNYSAIHKATGLSATGRNALQRPFSHSRLKGFFFSIPQELYQAKLGTALPAALWIVLQISHSFPVEGAAFYQIMKIIV